ncbi:charged multivesicular body protein 4 [Trypanosoma grayi]|uniref:charged multivesicular body protein 4 n=1 Tax=Trypanosoma grayi TaxID=71804 RepID=UPI0004F4295D|nr:charged multivesicular body protein 4 [Trypanosoma grayi]KEG08877.1 charged multivesicular body protein 4 [Trypanosoma grayi]
MFSRLFGRGDKQAKPRDKSRTGGSDGPQSIEKLETSIGMLEKREVVLEKNVEEQLNKAKVFLANKNKPAALQCMKRKKFLETELLGIATQRQNLESLKWSIQNQNMTSEVLAAQQQAKEVLKMNNKKMDADRVEENMEELMEEMDKANTISEALRQPLDTGVVDEDELMAELMEEVEDTGVQQMQQQHKTEKLPEMPSVPTGVLPQKTKAQQKEYDEEEALRALEAELQS